jgi:hypothetical protein
MRHALLIVFSIFLTTHTTGQVFVKLKVQFPNQLHTPAHMYTDMPISMGVEFEKKIGIDKALSIGISNRSYKFSSDVNWTSNNDFMSYVRDYTQNDLIDGWLADPEINFHYIHVPVGFRIQSRLFFGLKYQVGFNFLVKKPMFVESEFEVPIPFEGHAPVVIDHNLTVFFSAFGFFDMFGCYTLSQPLVKNNPYAYDFMKDFAGKQTVLSYGMNFALTKFKRKSL